MEKIELTKKEREILTLLARCRYATTKQIVAPIFRIVSIRELLSEELTYF